jgi:hypothetical protein
MNDLDWVRLCAGEKHEGTLLCDYCEQPEAPDRYIFVSGLKPVAICHMCVGRFHAMVDATVERALIERTGESLH